MRITTLNRRLAGEREALERVEGEIESLQLGIQAATMKICCFTFTLFSPAKGDEGDDFSDPYSLDRSTLDEQKNRCEREITRLEKEIERELSKQMKAGKSF